MARKNNQIETKTNKSSTVHFCLINILKFFFTHWHTCSSSEMAIMPTSGSHDAMPKHVWLFGRRLLFGFEPRSLSCRSSTRNGTRGTFAIVTNVYISDKPFQWWVFDHRRRWGGLNSRESVDSATKSVARIWSGTRNRTWHCTCRSYNCWTSGKCRLSSPDFVTFLCGILKNYTLYRGITFAWF